MSPKKLKAHTVEEWIITPYKPYFEQSENKKKISRKYIAEEQNNGKLTVGKILCEMKNSPNTK